MYRYYSAVEVGELYSYKERRCRLLEKGVGADGIAWAKVGAGRNLDQIHLVKGDAKNRTRLYDLGLEWDEHKKEQKNKVARNKQARDIERMIDRGAKGGDWTHVRVKYVGWGDRGEIVITGNMEKLANLAYRFEHCDPPARQSDSALDKLFGGVDAE